MSLYFDTTYPKDEKNEYPQKYADYMFNRFFKKGQYILDVGCANGSFLHLLSKKDMKCVGIDLREEKLVDEWSFIFKKCNIEKDRFPFPNNFLDFVYNKSVISMLIDPSNFFNESRRILKPGGKFITLIPDWKANYKWYYDDPYYVKSYTRKGLEYLYKMNEFKNIQSEYLYQLPIVWEYPQMKLVCKLIEKFVPDRFKFKTREQRNTLDNKFIRFSKERMILIVGEK